MSEIDNYKSKHSFFVGIDVGVSNIAIVCTVVNNDWFTCRSKDYSISEALVASYAERISLKEFIHRRVPQHKCTLFHEKTACDRVDHFIQEFEELWRDADKILIERQPICGLVDIEQLLFRAFRNKVKLIHPCSMHRYFGISQLDYEARKDATVDISSNYLGHMEEFKREDRQHDMADALCLTLYYCHLRKQEILREQYSQQIVSAAKLDAFECRGFGYLYVHSKSRIENALQSKELIGWYSQKCAELWGCIEMETPDGQIVDVTHIFLDQQYLNRVDSSADIEYMGPVVRWIAPKLCGRYYDDPETMLVMVNV